MARKPNQAARPERTEGPRTLQAFFEQQQQQDLLRFITCGSVDDGKSTLIGRLLFDSKSLFEDQLDTINREAEMTGIFNLANLTDGLRAEREQGITIDVAYRFFATPKRKFIVADTPGHVQYTRNMVTGASTANLAVVLLDARKGVIEQTRRHSFLASLLGIPHLCLAINKMDMVNYDEATYQKIKEDFEDFSTRLNIKDITYIPLSALKGDNVVNHSENMPWYKGPTFLSFIENVHIASDQNFTDPRFPVQYVIRPHSDEHHDFRGFAGSVAGGVFRTGDEIVVMPSGKRSKIKEIWFHDRAIDVAFPPMSVALRLEHEIDVCRGNMIVKAESVPYFSTEAEAMLCWFNDKSPMVPGRKYILKQTTQTTTAVITDLQHKINITTLEKESAEGLALNEIGRVSIKANTTLMYDGYLQNRNTGSFILIDEATNGTVAAGMIIKPNNPPPAAPFPDYVI